MTTELLGSYCKIFGSIDETDNGRTNTSQSILNSPHIKSDCSKRTKNNNSLERFLADNIYVYGIVETGNLSSSGISNVNTDSGDNVISVNGDAENKNDVDIPGDWRFLFARTVDQIKTNNNKIKYVMSINKSLQEDIAL